MARLHASLLNDEERAMLDERTLTVLEDVGVAVPVWSSAVMCVLTRALPTT